MELNPEDTSSKDIYKLLIGAVLPRPIAWVSTIDISGNVNLAPFSFFTVASVNPPVLCFCPLLKPEAIKKDTLVNIEETGEFVINIVSANLGEKMNQTSAPYPTNVNEFGMTGLTAKPSTFVKPPRVEESLINFECKLHEIICFGSEPMAGSLVLGKICNIHVESSIYNMRRIDGEALDAIGRLAGNMYVTTRGSFEMERPT